MGSRKGKKNLTKKDIENIKTIIRPRFKFRDTNKQLLLCLEDNGYNISENKLIDIKREMRNEIKQRFEEIGTYELAEEHDLAIQVLKMLENKIIDAMSMAESPRDIISCSQELRNIKKDLVEFYGSSEIVENVFKYFEEKYGEKGKEAVEKIKNERKK